MDTSTSQFNRREFMRTTVRWSAGIALGTIAGLGVFRGGRIRGAGCWLPCTGCPAAGRCSDQPTSRTPQLRKQEEDPTDESSPTAAVFE